MSERSTPIDLGASTADATNVRFEVDGARVVVRFVDWREISRELVFDEPIGVRWIVASDAHVDRDDTTYEVLDSEWLARSVREHGLRREAFVHYQLGFNHSGMVLDILARKR